MEAIIKSLIPILLDGEKYRVTSPFGWRVDPVSGQGNGAHKGIDLVLWRDTWSDVSSIGAAWPGTVKSTKNTVSGFSKTDSAGNYVTIDHGNGYTTKYFHLALGSVCVAVGEQVKAGQKIGDMGSTGYSTGAHLHFQVEKNGVPVDPYPILVEETNPVVVNKPETESEMDNTPADWADTAVRWAQDNGILYGDEHGNLRLHDPCTREMMLVFLHRAMGGGA